MMRNVHHFAIVALYELCWLTGSAH